MVLQCSLEPSQEAPALLVSLQNHVRQHYKSALSYSGFQGVNMLSFHCIRKHPVSG